jgi:hypothetical protein
VTNIPDASPEFPDISPPLKSLGFSTPKIGGFGIIGKRANCAIQSEVIDAHEWTETTSSDGVAGFVTQVDFRVAERSPTLSWIEVNEATHKLTDGTMERTPACHGKWPGFNIERGIALVFDTSLPPHSKGVWFVRCGDRRYGPTSNLEKAKQVAMDFATTE